MIKFPEGHKSGFVNILGPPNVGKSTLLNALVGEKLSIITSKPQTTRHRILAMYNDELHQIVFSDTPGIVLDPGYEMHESMNRFAFSTLEDADLLLCMADIYEKHIEDNIIVERTKDLSVPTFLLLNKIDQAKDGQVEELAERWEATGAFDRIFPISAQENTGVEDLLKRILELLPEGPPYYPKDQLTDRNERFFVSEIIREKVFLHYRKEIPYATEVVIEEFTEDDTREKPFARIMAYIFVERNSQKNIIIGKGGSGIKKIGVEARADIEKLIGREVYLELRVKVRKNWRNNESLLRKLGYIS
ncbi:MAG: GTPase Era [Bacteroidetes bacterium]|jgi:GTP-binding protein Era|nr:GTPase Era [Bacteroidota bacterium]